MANTASTTNEEWQYPPAPGDMILLMCDESTRDVDGGHDGQRRASGISRTYLCLELVGSAATLAFELQSLVLLFVLGDNLPILHFHLAHLGYGTKK